MILNIKPMPIPKIKDIPISLRVVPKWRNNSPVLKSLTKVVQIWLGEENIKELIKPFFAPISHIPKNNTTNRTCQKRILILYFDI